MGLRILTKAVAAFLKTAVVIVPVGKDVAVPLPSRQDIAEAFNGNDRAALMTAGGMPRHVVMKGMAPGLTPLVLTDRKDRSRLFLVVVPKPSQ